MKKQKITNEITWRQLIVILIEGMFIGMVITIWILHLFCCK